VTRTLFALAVAWLAGACVVVRCLPARAAMPAVGLAGLAGVIGPGVVGVLLVGAGLIGLPSAVSRVAVPLLVITASALTLRRWRGLSHARSVGPGLTALLIVAAALTTVLALRTHLGWDGTVVWYHKARMIAANDGRMPSAAMADRTRSWTAPDYPLQVPLAMAWVLTWQDVDDERALKLLPASWSVALLCLVAGSVLHGRSDDRETRGRAAAAVLIVATTARLLVGEGGLTSGYADGPLAALLVALLWVARCSVWGTARQWLPLLAVIAAAAAWTKQEGLVAVLAVVIVVASRRPRRPWSAMHVATPALLIVIGWLAWTMIADAPVAMAYGWPGSAVAVSRLPVIVTAYVTEMADVAVWGVLWPGLALLLLIARAFEREETIVVAIVLATGAAAFVMSGWPDVGEHLEVTVPRQLIQVAPTLIAMSLGHATPAEKSA
jgi:hypothetical protein